MDITSKQRAKLKALATNEETLFQVGKNGVTEQVISKINEALKKRELVKIRALETAPGFARELAEEIAEKTDSLVVATIGSKMIFYKQNKKKPLIEL